MIELGDGWACSTVNTVVFRHHGIVTRGSFQFGAYYEDGKRMVVFRRDLRGNTVDSHLIGGSYNVRDAHNSISLGIDPAGHALCLRVALLTQPLSDHQTSRSVMTVNNDSAIQIGS